MIEEDIYCDDVLNQIASIKSALNGLSKALLERHLNTCVVDKIKNDDTNPTSQYLDRSGWRSEYGNGKDTC